MGAQRFVVVDQDGLAGWPVTKHSVDEGAVGGALGNVGVQEALDGSARGARGDAVFVDGDREMPGLVCVVARAGSPSPDRLRSTRPLPPRH